MEVCNMKRIVNPAGNGFVAIINQVSKDYLLWTTFFTFNYKIYICKLLSITGAFILKTMLGFCQE